MNTVSSLENIQKFILKPLPVQANLPFYIKKPLQNRTAPPLNLNIRILIDLLIVLLPLSKKFNETFDTLKYCIKIVGLNRSYSAKQMLQWSRDTDGVT